MNTSSVREKLFTYILHSYILSTLHILNSYVVYLHLDQVLFMNFRSGKELGELEFKAK